MFMPFISERLRKEVGSESCTVVYFARIVASKLLLLNGILKMLLVEPYMHLTPLLGPEDEAALIETIT
ncbi:hypothetical protein YC2023_067318 [Brassica napus]